MHGREVAFEAALRAMFAKGEEAPPRNTEGPMCFLSFNVWYYTLQLEMHVLHQYCLRSIKLLLRKNL